MPINLPFKPVEIADVETREGHGHCETSFWVTSLTPLRKGSVGTAAQSEVSQDPTQPQHVWVPLLLTRQEPIEV